MTTRSLFFITSYYSDFILVPSKSRTAVNHALEERGFVFQQIPSTNGYHRANGSPTHMTAIASPSLSLSTHNRNLSATNSPFDSHFSRASAPGTPPPSSIAEWATRTFNTLHAHSITPKVDPSLRVATCAGHRSDRLTQDRLFSILTQCLISPPPPRFLSITLTDADSTSITVDQEILARWPNQGDGVLLMSEEISVPIMLDLRGLNEQRSTGIVCGVAGRLIERLGTGLSGSGNLVRGPTGFGSGAGVGFNMSYLSTAKAGNVMVREDEVEEALQALKEIAESRDGSPGQDSDEQEGIEQFVPSQPVDFRRR